MPFLEIVGPEQIDMLNHAVFSGLPPQQSQK